MLKFNGIEPVEFGGVAYTPKPIDAERRLRLAEVSYETSEKSARSDDTLAECFEDEKAKAFIREKLSPDDKSILAVYLGQGETGLNRLNDATNQAIERFIERSAK